MTEAGINAKHIHSLTDFLRNYKAHIANLKETMAPEVLTVNGRAEVVILDALSYQNLIDQVRHLQAVVDVRQILSRDQIAENQISREEVARRTAVMEELVAETERLGLYK